MERESAVELAKEAMQSKRYDEAITALKALVNLGTPLNREEYTLLSESYALMIRGTEFDKALKICMDCKSYFTAHLSSCLMNSAYFSTLIGANFKMVMDCAPPFYWGKLAYEHISAYETARNHMKRLKENPPHPLVLDVEEAISAFYHTKYKVVMVVDSTDSYQWTAEYWPIEKVID